MFQDMVDKESGTAGKSMNDNSYISGSSDGVRSRNIEMQFMGGETKTSPSTRFERGNIVAILESTTSQFLQHPS